MDFGEVFVVGFVTTTDDDYEIVVWEGIDGYTGRGWVGGEVVVVVFDAVKLAEEFEAMWEAFESFKTGKDLGNVIS